MIGQQEWIVELTTTTCHTYVVTARTEEAAVSIAEGLFQDGDNGEVISRDVEIADAYPYEESDEDEDEG